MMQLPANHRVYFVQNPQTGAVKIGWSADPARRIQTLSTGAGCDLGLLRLIPGGPATERWLHKRFSGLRIKGEWFSYHPDMLTIVPPDEVPIVPEVRRRRDVRLTLKERISEKMDLAKDLGLSQRQALLMIVTDLREDEASEAISLLLKASVPNAESAAKGLVDLEMDAPDPSLEAPFDGARVPKMLPGMRARSKAWIYRRSGSIADGDHYRTILKGRGLASKAALIQWEKYWSSIRPLLEQNPTWEIGDAEDMLLQRAAA